MSLSARVPIYSVNIIGYLVENGQDTPYPMIVKDNVGKYLLD